MIQGFTGPRADLNAIIDLNLVYADAVHRNDAAAWAGLWTEDAVWDLAGHVVAGRETIAATWRGAMAAFAQVAFQVQPGAIHVDGTTATARIGTVETLIALDGSVRHVIGRYEDALVRQDAGWRFARRRYQILHDRS